MTTASIRTRQGSGSSTHDPAGKPYHTPHRAEGIKVPGRSSVAQGPDNQWGTVNGLFSQYAPLGYLLPFEILDYIEILAKWNPDYSQAVDNIKTLANSGHELFIDAPSDLQRNRTRALIDEKARLVQVRNGGIDGLIGKLLDQAAVYGAMCGEWIVNEDLTEVVDFADVNPKSIRFFWDEQSQDYVPFQKVNAAQQQKARDNGQEVRNGCIRLNPITFHYYAFDAAPGSPYGTPPFIASLAPIAVQRDMVENMSQIVKKVGLLGIIDVIVNQLPPQPGESAETYQGRAVQYLDSYVNAVQDMVTDGGIVHFDDVEIKTQQITGNAAGATNIFKQNEEQVFSGLKSMPSVQGRSYSTTETYAGVAYDIIIRNTGKYQRAAKRMIEAGYWLMATLSGLTPDTISVEFKSNKTLHRLQEAQAEAIELKNGLVLWVTGVIDQQGFAQRVGFADVKNSMEDPPDSAIIGNAGNLNTSGSGDTGARNPEQPPNASAAPATDENGVDLTDPWSGGA